MALNPTVLGQQLALLSNPLGPTPVEIAHWTAIANAIITHFQSFGVVNTSVTTSDTIQALGLVSPGGLTPAPVTGVAKGAGTGTGVGTIS